MKRGRKLRVLDRPTASFRASLLAVDIDDVFGAGLPRTNDDDMRYAMFGRLLNVIRPLGYQSILVLVDRMDEPTLINGEPERMRALVWPTISIRSPTERPASSAAASSSDASVGARGI